ncbi:hypothetical protein P7K49_036407 [Saguinus oedipus]|uniref:Uncharacterized protein n=1 Tax=Saguinus oedipus TaxID=9490 RepID=A0ABQ9TK15_SAGOE|nr:hypothetical protein P7K49_036407 [Saguinus oedipus]
MAHAHSVRALQRPVDTNPRIGAQGQSAHVSEPWEMRRPERLGRKEVNLWGQEDPAARKSLMFRGGWVDVYTGSRLNGSGHSHTDAR